MSVSFPLLFISLPPPACFFEKRICLWSYTCDKVSAWCFPFTTTLLCSSELEAVTQERRNNMQGSDINSLWSSIQNDVLPTLVEYYIERSVASEQWREARYFADFHSSCLLSHFLLCLSINLSYLAKMLDYNFVSKYILLVPSHSRKWHREIPLSVLVK